MLHQEQLVLYQHHHPRTTTHPSIPHYVVNANNISDIQNYYDSCNSISSSGNDHCEVIQSIIGGTSAVEGYKNYNDSRYSTHNTANIGQNSEYNMVTNELCKEITEPDRVIN